MVFPPSLWSSLFLLASGLALLVAGGEALVSGAVKLAWRQGMSSLLIGLTVVAFGTSMPELFVSVSATLQGHPDIMVGNVVGSNIANIGLILGLMALLTPLRIELKRIGPELGLAILVSVAVLGIGFLDTFSRAWGLFFVTGLVLYTAVSYRQAAREKTGQEQPENIASWRLIFLLMVGGLLLLALGSDFFIDGAVRTARLLGVPELLIGLTLAAVGTSLPELASSLSALRRRQGDLVLGNVVGSNLFNLMMVMGVTGLITPFRMAPVTLARDLPVMLLFTVALALILWLRQGLGRVHGAVLLAAYGGYLYLLH